MKTKRSFSIRYKLLLLLVTVPVIALLFYLFLAISLFTNDKLAYIFDSSAAASHTLATQVRVEAETLVNSHKVIADGYDLKTKNFSAVGKWLFDKDSSILFVGIFEPNRFDHYVQTAQLKKQWPSSIDEATFLQTAKKVSETASLSKKSLSTLGKLEDIVLVGVRYGSPETADQHVVVSMHKTETLIKAFKKSVVYQSFLVENGGEVLLAPEKMKNSKDFGTWGFFNNIKQRNLPEGTADIVAPDGQKLLMSYAQVGVGGLTVVSFVPKETAFRAVTILFGKSVLFFLAIISAAIIVSVFASRQLTSTLRALYGATQSVAEGKYDVDVDVTSNDEVGALASNFNKMAQEINRLMQATAQKARMEKELETAKTVQETLFPPSNSTARPLKISGYYQAASECGGDWWHYCQIGTKTYVWIGDATGHGVPAALVTSAAKSAASVIEVLPSVSPATAMQFLNRAIHETSKGKMLMTFFLGCFDETTGDFTYCNASHDPPFFLKPKAGTPLKKSDIITLNDVNNPRLGQKPDTVFKETTVKVDPGDFIILYTDGVLDLHNPEKQPWGERKFIKTVLDIAAKNQAAEQTMEQLSKQMIEYRKNAELIDDVTCFVCKYEKAS